jgi:hypothetical protein
MLIKIYKKNNKSFNLRIDIMILSQFEIDIIRNDVSP